MAYKYRAKSALRDELVKLNDGQVSGYVSNAQHLLGQVYYRKLTKNYLQRVIGGHVDIGRRLALCIVRVIEDDPAGLEMALFNLRKAGYDVEGARDGDEGLRLFSRSRHAMVITDVKMPGLSGLEVLERIKADAPDTPVIVITAYGDVDMAVGAMKTGAYDFIGKPFNRDHLLLVVGKALERRQLVDEVRTLRRKTSGVERLIIAASEAMRQVLDVTDRVAGSDASVMITGETGTGKELVARRVHARSARSGSPFVAVNCAAIPENLLESELFGHVRGAFTGAVRDRPGRVARAEGGTLFLDEVGDLPLLLQAKLLRLLQERTYERVGEDRTRETSVRVVAATNAELEQHVADGSFREDLYYRLRVIPVHLPPLRERRDDIPLLATRLLAERAKRLGRDQVRFSAAALQRLETEYELSRAAVDAGEPSAEQALIVRTWTEWYEAALHTAEDIEVGGASPQTRAAIDAAVKRVAKAGQGYARRLSSPS